MEKYEPESAPDPETWLALDQGDRLYLVTEYVKQFENDLEEPAKRVHAAIHVIVENQIAMQEEPAPETCERLVREGLGRHEAIHALGAVISEDMFEIMKGNKDAPFEKYKGRMKKLTAKRWKKGKW